MIFALLLPHCSAGVEAAREAKELGGYLENWSAKYTKWWDNNMPANCKMGCEVPELFLKDAVPYTSVNYGFTFLTTKPDPEKTACASAQDCPAWDGDAIYAAAKSKDGAAVVTLRTTNATALTAAAVSIGEVCRLLRQSPLAPPKRCIISLGGWSDWARLGSIANAKSAARLAATMVSLTFADGIDLDFEHLTEFAAFGPEFEAFSAFTTTLREELDARVSQDWVATAISRSALLNASYRKLQPWQKAEAPYYATNIQYLSEVAKNGPPDVLSISFTTRFNAFIDKTAPFNYINKGSPRPNASFATDGEGTRLWPTIAKAVNTVNVMAYDASGLSLNFTQILLNFAAGGVPREKVVIGYEPGNQAAGGIWEGAGADEKDAEFIAAEGFGGGFIWAMNPDVNEAPVQAKNAPLLAAALNSILKPGWPFGQQPVYSKVDARTGWAPTPPAPGPTPPPPPPPPPSPSPSPVPPAPSPKTCHAVPGSSATDSWCNENCNHSPPNCPTALCSVLRENGDAAISDVMRIPWIRSFDSPRACRIPNGFAIASLPTSVFLSQLFHLEHVHFARSSPAANVTKLGIFDMFGVFSYAADLAQPSMLVVTSDPFRPSVPAAPTTLESVLPPSSNSSSPGNIQFLTRFNANTGKQMGSAIRLNITADDSADGVLGLAVFRGGVFGTRFPGPFGWYNGVYMIDTESGGFDLIAGLPADYILDVDSFCVDREGGTYYFMMQLGFEGPAGVPGSPQPPIDLYVVDLRVRNGSAKVVHTSIDPERDVGLRQPSFHRGMLYGFTNDKRLATLDPSTGVLKRFSGGWAAPGYISSDSVWIDPTLGPSGAIILTGSLDGKKAGSYIAAVSLADGTLVYRATIDEPLHYMVPLSPATDLPVFSVK